MSGGIRDSQFMTTAANDRHRTRRRQADTLAALQPPKQDSCFDARCR